MKTFVEAVQEFVDTSPWLKPEDQVAIVSLFRMAEELDEQITGPIMSAFGLTYRNLMKKTPKEEAADELDQLLKR